MQQIRFDTAQEIKSNEIQKLKTNYKQIWNWSLTISAHYKIPFGRETYKIR